MKSGAALALLTTAALASAKAAAQEPIVLPVPGGAPADSPARTDNPAYAWMEWSAVRGVNYLAGYAASPDEMWRRYDPEAIRRELGAAARLGLNSVRVFLSFRTYEATPTSFLEHWGDFLTAAGETGLTVLPVLFDGWGVDPPRLARRESTRAAFERFLSRPATYRLHPTYERSLKTIALELTPDRGVPAVMDPGSVYWGDWRPSPEPDRLGPEHWPLFEEFVVRMIEPRRTDPAIVAWDLMNEPQAGQAFTTAPPNAAAAEFVLALARRAHELDPAQPITIGAGGGWDGATAYRLHVELISLHAYQKPGSRLAADLAEARRQSDGRPLLITHVGGIMFPASAAEAAEAAQAEAIRQTLAMAERARAGFYLWHLIEGPGLTPWAGLLRSDGSARPAAEGLAERAPRR